MIGFADRLDIGPNNGTGRRDRLGRVSEMPSDGVNIGRSERLLLLASREKRRQ
ncbi:MAG: hypothetical protein NVS9B4_03090 [Candidatus Acidiferrum sp.]